MGLGYIGLPTAIIAAKHGVTVTGVDINQEVVDKTNAGHLHIIEPGLEDLLKEVVAAGQLHATTQPEKSDAFFIVVPTPFRGGNHEPDISYVEAATRSVIPFLEPGNLFVIESTSPVGTTDKMAKIIFEERPDLVDKIHVAYCPERVLPGNVIYELVHNDRVIGGRDEASTAAAQHFYSQFCYRRNEDHRQVVGQCFLKHFYKLLIKQVALCDSQYTVFAQHIRIELL